MENSVEAGAPRRGWCTHPGRRCWCCGPGGGGLWGQAEAEQWVTMQGGALLREPVPSTEGWEPLHSPTRGGWGRQSCSVYKYL